MDLEDWLRQRMLAATAYDAAELLDAFLEEMRRGLDGETSSLAMIPAHVHVGEEIEPGRAVAVIDAGGTNLRTGIARFDEAGRIALSGFRKQPMPGRDREWSADEFYAVLCDALAPHADAFDAIGFCFSYPATILPNYDGRLLHWTKEIKIPELVGRHVGEGLLEALERRGVRGKRVVLLNDTVAAVLAGVAEGRAFDASSYVGFILGTGTNTAYVERNGNIGKLDGFLSEGTQIVNVESGGFNAFRRGPFDLRLDERSDRPGVNVFEKVISGTYMGPLTLEALKALSEESAVFSDGAREALGGLEELSTIHVDNLVAGKPDIGPFSDASFGEGDLRTVKRVFAAVVERASFFAAVNMLAAVVKSGEGREAARPVCVNADGSTYYKTWSMEERVQAFLGELLAERGLHARCVRVDDAPVVGAAIAALTVF